MNDAPSSLSVDERLATRVTGFHLRQRLGIENAKEARVFGQGCNYFHIENWYSMHAAIRQALRLCGLSARGHRNALRLEVRQNPIALANLPREFEGLKLLHVSDLHLDMADETPDALIEALNGTHYDVAVLTGDFRARTYGPIEPALEALSRVRPYLNETVYAVLGNHDSLRMVPAMEDMGIRVLLNESITLERGSERIYLCGIDDPHYFGTDNMERAASDIPPYGTSILLAHSPEVYRQAAHAGFSMMLCGHTHGGQICLPGGKPVIVNARCPRRYCKGAWRYHSLVGYTSVGSGASIVHARLNCLPEIAIHRLGRA